MEAHAGNAAEINLLLTAALREVGFEAYPVILSTRSNGKVVSGNALLKQFNYTIVAVVMGDRYLFLDATSPALKPGMLPIRCLNGSGLLITADNPQWVEITPNERFVTSKFYDLAFDTEGNINGTGQVSYDGYSAYSERIGYLANGKDKYQEEFKKERKEWNISEIEVSNATDLSKNFSVKCTQSWEESGALADHIYLQPLLSERESKNPFVSQVRKYPVDLGAPLDEVVSFRYKIPAGYVIESIPKSIHINLPENAGSFRYSVGSSADQIQIMSRISLKKPIYIAEEYDMLRAFYDQIVAKHAEQIVLKKQ
jgi:hypothetical protein